MTTRKLLFFAALLAALITYTLAHAALVPKAECKTQCAPSIAVECLQRHGQVLRVKPACRARLIRQCRHHKDVCTTTTTTTTSTTTTTTTTSTTTTTTAGPECPATGCLHVLDFTTAPAGGPCGELDDGAGVKLRTLTCGGLSIGGGQGIVPEGPTPDGSRNQFQLTCAAPASGVCAISAIATPPAANSTDPDCTTAGCNFGAPLPIPSPVGSLTSCVMNTLGVDASGTLDLDTGASVTTISLQSDTYITGNAAQPCPLCKAGTCDRGPNAGHACTTTNSGGLSRDCPTGGVGPGKSCDPGQNCVDGTHVGIITVNLTPLGTGDASATAPDGVFCMGQGFAGCFNAGDCRTIKETGALGGAFALNTPITARLASVFCIPATGNGLVDSSVNLPGPGALTLPGTFTVR